MKKLLVILCSICLFLNYSVTASAQIIETTAETDSVNTINNTESDTSPWPEDAPSIYSEAAIVMEASTGAILYSKDIHESFYPASITKILTSLLAIENSSLGESVTFSKEAIFDVDLDSSRIGIDVGEVLTMEQCLYGIMLESANEVSYAVGEHVSGSIESFITLMNEKAVELGCTNTNFVNPNGLPDPNHYTSAYDMALISKAAINNDIFREITGTHTYTIPPTNIQEEARPLANHHKFVCSSANFEGCIGGKTGYTTKAKYTLVTFAERNGMTLISVIMHCDSIEHEYSDTASILNYAYDNYTKYNIAEIEEPNSVDNFALFTKYSPLFSVTNPRLKVSTTGNIVLPNTASSSDAQKEITLTPLSSMVDGENVIGSISYTYNGAYVGSADIIYDNSATPLLLNDSFIPIPTPTTSAQLDNANEPVSSSSTNLKPLIIGIIFGIIVLGVGLYIRFVEIPYRRRKSAYNQKRARKKHSSDKFDIDF